MSLKLPKDKQLYAWQKDFIENHNHDRVLLVAEAGTGKSVASICWLQLRSDKKALVVAPKGIQLKWKEDLAEWNAVADVCTTDAIKKINLDQYEAIVIDECQNVNSALFDKSRSGRATVLYNFIRTHPDVHILMASATPIRSKPENLHTLACYKGIYWPIKDFRDEFLHLTDRFGRYHYEPNKDWRVKIRPKLEQIGHIVNMKDCVDVPVHEHTTINIKWTQAQENELKGQYLEPAREWHARHRAEQGDGKWAELEKILDGHAKVVVVCYYLSQIADYAKRIGDERQLYVLTGSTKDQGRLVKEANECPDCVLIIQAGLGAGFDLDKFSVMVYASMSFAFVHYVQMSARINRIHNLHKNQYIYLLGGKCDRAVKERIDLGMDFHPPAYYTKGDGQSPHTPNSATEARSQSDSDSGEMVSGELPF